MDKVISALKQDTERSFDLRSECGDIGPCDIVNSETSSYCQVILEWVRHWPAKTRQKIILEHSLSRKGQSELNMSLSVMFAKCTTS